MIDFSLAPELQDLRQRVTDFVRDEVIPAEVWLDEHTGLPADRLAILRQRARQRGLFAPQLAPVWGGLGLNRREQCLILEAAGQSLIGPLALNCAAPDEGNMHLLEVVGTAAQRERYLRPLAAGESRSCFAMTEPPPGAGADPSMLQTRAERRGDRWRLNGDKWFITGAAGADFAICMAASGPRADGRPGATMFLIDSDTPGWRVTRQIPALDGWIQGGHCEVELRDCLVGDEAVLGEVGLGFRYAQVRLAPARLTHCMRWLGIAQRALDCAVAYASHRHSFGHPLAHHQLVGGMLADSAIELQAARLLTWQAAWVLDQGGQARQESAMAKTYVSEVVGRVVDRALQICGSHGVATDQPLAMFYRAIRPFRIYDGPNEVHRMAIARRLVQATAEPVDTAPSAESSPPTETSARPATEEG